MVESSGEQARADVPEVGTILDTIYGRAQVMDVLHLPDEPETVYLRPERGGLEWTVTTTQLPSVLRSRSVRPATTSCPTATERNV